MDHNNVSLTVSPNEAAKVDDEAKRRLLASKKLSLVVDLDQTIIHATVDPTVNEWQRDQENPNYEAVKDVQSFQLKDDGPRKVGEGCWYYIKLRPGLQQFLENVAKMYELHIYTMGTRQYAKNIANIIDPDRRIFGDRVLSRDESGSMTAKNLQRLFPVDTKMVVIIDDRGDVWKWSPNLIKVTPYDFFVGIGDINSSFLPKKPELRTSTKPGLETDQNPPSILTEGSPMEGAESQNQGAEAAAPDAQTNNLGEIHIDATSSPIDHLVAMSGANGFTSREEQTSNQDEALVAQLEEKPLLQKQKQLEADDAASEATPSQEEREDGNLITEEIKESERPRHSLLHDNDRELYRLEESLRAVHSAFFNAYAQQLAAAQGGRLGKLRGSQKQKSPTDKSDLDLVPDIKNILPGVKSRVLGGTVLVFSGIVPLGLDVASTDIAILSRSFGAIISDDITRSTTHVVAARNRTQKVRAAVKRGKGRIKIVSPSWLLESISEWERKDETPYLLDVEEPRNGSFHDDEILSESESEVSEFDEESDPDSDKSRERPPLSLSIKPPPGAAEDEETDVEGVLPEQFDVDDKSPVGGTNEDWNAMNDELKDFLGSEAEDEEDEEDGGAESEASTTSKISIRGRKRVRGDDAESDSGSDSDAKRQRKKHVPGKKVAPTMLSQSTVASDDEDNDNNNQQQQPKGASGSARSEAAGVEVGPEAEVTAGKEGEEEGEERKEGDGWSDFEDEDFEAELERAGSEEQGEGG